MRLVQLIYVSEVTGRLTLDTVQAILNTAIKRNPVDNITGFLAFNSKNFLQVIEGGSIKINELFMRISKDPRSHSFNIISYREIETRQFPHFAMGDCDLESVDNSLIERYTDSDVFDAGKLTAEDSLELLLALERIRRQELSTHAI